MALVASAVAHGVLCLLVLGVPRAPQSLTVSAESTVQVELLESSAPDAVAQAGGVAPQMPVLPDALPSPVLTIGDHAEAPTAQVPVRRRTLVQRARSDEGASESVDVLPSAPITADDAGVRAAAPSAVGEAAASAAEEEPEQGEGEGGDGDGHAGGGVAPEGPTEPHVATEATESPPTVADRCGDPFNGVWEGEIVWRRQSRHRLRLMLRRGGRLVSGEIRLRSTWRRVSSRRGCALDDWYDAMVAGSVNGGELRMTSERLTRDSMTFLCGVYDDALIGWGTFWFRISAALAGPDRMIAHVRYGWPTEDYQLARVGCE